MDAALRRGALDDGVLLESVIHQVNNPLASLLLSLERLREQLSGCADAEVLRMALEAHSEGKRVAEAVRALDALFPLEPPRRLDAESALASVLSWLEQRYPDITVQRRFAPRLPVFVREARFAQLFRAAGQLLIDAQRASRPDSRIQLVAEAEEQPPHLLKVSLRCSEDTPAFNAILHMDASRLSVLRGLVQQLGGSLALSAAGVALLLPVHAPIYESELEVDVQRRHSMPPRGSLRILVVDDEPGMHRALTRGLAELGLVQAVGSMETAVELIQGGAKFDVILTDLVMPEGTGLELLDWLVRNKPSWRKRIILMTGLAETHADSHPDVVVVGKPFDLPALRELVCQVASRR